MNRKQWFVLGIGLILLSIPINLTGMKQDCSDLQFEVIEQQFEAVESGANLQEALALNKDAWVISCLDMRILLSTLYSILAGLGIIFIILGFLEPKGKK